MHISIPSKIETALVKLGTRMGKDPQSMLNKALEEYLEDQLDLFEAQIAHAEWVKGGKKTYSMEEIMKECHIERSDLDS